MGVGRSSLAYGKGQMDDDDLYRLRRALFPDYPDSMNIKRLSLFRDPVSTVLFRMHAFVAACSANVPHRLQLVRP